MDENPLKQLSSERGAVYKPTPRSAQQHHLSAFLLQQHHRRFASKVFPPCCFLILQYFCALPSIPSIGESETQVYPMATARKLSLMFAVAVLVASISFADVAEGAVLGRTLKETKLQEQAGTGQFTWVKLPANTLVNVECRLQSSTIGPDNWWLKATVMVPNGDSGYVADFDMQCAGDTPAGHCDPAPHC